VAENLGKGLINDPLINQGVKVGVNDIFKKFDLTHISLDIRRSEYKGKFPRDFWAFLPKNDNEYNIALAVGGTKVQAGSVDKGGNLLNGQILGGSWKQVLTKKGILPSNKEASKDEVIDYIVELIEKVNKNTNIPGKTLAKIGISWAGPGKYWDGLVRAPNIWGFEDQAIDLIAEIKNKLSQDLKDIEIEIQHDGIAAVQGEISPAGTFPGKENIISVIWGTGIGAGILIDRKSYYDFLELRDLGIPLGEIGHHIIFVK
jgi:predicted NBD/HSP70 family sugar kinase